MPSRLPRPLSGSERKLRIDAVAVALRRLRLVDDGSISQLFLSQDYPTERKLAQAIGRLEGISASLKPADIASVVLSEIVASDANRALLLPPSVEAPDLSVISQGEVSEVASRIIDQFKHAVEHQALWRELWNGQDPCNERRCQALFKFAATTWCQAYNIDLSAEVDIGRGPADFKMSCGWTSRVLIEAKLASNKKFWSGLRKQLPQYMTSERIECGYFVAFGFDASDEKRLDDINAVANEASSETGYVIDAIYIDARKDNKESASKL